MRTIIVAAMVAISAPFLSASLIVTAPVGGTTTTFDTGSTCSGSASGTDAGFSISANGQNCLPYSGSFGLNDNGNWNLFPLIGDNSGSTALIIDLGGLFSSVGGFINYAQVGGTPVGPLDPTITALAADGTTVLETYDLAVSNPISVSGTNQGVFLGIDTGTNNIGFFEISGSFIVMDNITTSASSVPEPASFAMISIALGVLFLAASRRRSPATR